MKKDPLIFIKHILEAIDALESYSKGFSRETLLTDRMRKDAIVRELEIIGEAVKNLPKDFTAKYPQVEWSDIARTRDIIIHRYFGIDLNEIWNIVTKDLPKLKKDISEILEKEKKSK